MDLEGIVLGGISEETQMQYDFTYMWNLKNKIKNKKSKLTDTQNTKVTRWEGGWRVSKKGIKK